MFDFKKELYKELKKHEKAVNFLKDFEKCFDEASDLEKLIFLLYYTEENCTEFELNINFDQIHFEDGDINLLYDKMKMSNKEKTKNKLRDEEGSDYKEKYEKAKEILESAKNLESAYKLIKIFY